MDSNVVVLNDKNVVSLDVHFLAVDLRITKTGSGAAG